MVRIILLFLIFGLISCNQKDDNMPEPVEEQPTIYFPPTTSESWATTSPVSLGWNTAELDGLYDFLQTNNTRAFIILKDGKIVVEQYWGNNITNTAPFDQKANWYWASAGKTITAFLVGLAQEQGHLSISDKTSEYLGQGWTSMAPEKEAMITIRHQLTMTTGLDYTVPDIYCTDPECLRYKADPGAQWFYHNAPYTLLEQVVSNAVGISYNQYTDNELEQKIGMSGQWIKSGFNNVYWSKARDMARFGLLILNEGKRREEVILSDQAYYEDMVTTSQQLNPSYGYLWWLNGKRSVILPGLPNFFNFSIAPNAPDDLFAAMGKNGQFVDVVPSENLVMDGISDPLADGAGCFSREDPVEVFTVIRPVILHSGQKGRGVNGMDDEQRAINFFGE